MYEGGGVAMGYFGGGDGDEANDSGNMVVMVIMLFW